MDEQSVFLEALQKETAEERAAFLAEACGDDEGLRHEVEMLLKAHDKAGDFLQGSSVDNEMTIDQPASKKSGEMIGPYKLLEEIGEGGMGTVWVATQKEPIKRKVAIKLIKAGMDTKLVLARFEAERQALAMMDHPNIARVLDGGMTEDGRPFFAMEYVKGVPLTEYCDQAKLTIRDRLELFLPVCRAVQHAHQKGIIHRDLKPSNILVCLYDGKPVPKVIDFGLAKAIHHSLTDQSVFTSHGMMIGTPLYMSPEQAAQNNLDIDTRSDVYSLGVILYELLTGSTPLEKAQMKDAAVNEILRLIKDVDPPKPSTRISGSHTLPSVAAQRSIDPGHLARSVTGDLDWVVMKALEKERSRRYETANGLAEDIRRHLCDEPVSASPPSRTYKTRKFIKRNRTAVFAGSTMVVLLILGVIGTTWGMFRANEAAEAEQQARMDAERLQTIALDESEKAKKAADAEKQANEQIQKQVKQLQKTNDLLNGIFSDFNLHQSDHVHESLETAMVNSLLNAANELKNDEINDPVVVAHLKHRLGETLNSLGKSTEAIELLTNALAIFQQQLGDEHDDALECKSNLAAAYAALPIPKFDVAIPMLEECLDELEKIKGVHDEKTIVAKNNLISCYTLSGKYEISLPLLKETFDLLKKEKGLEDPSTLHAMNDLGACYWHLTDYKQAKPILEECVRLSKVHKGAGHPGTLISLGNLAACYNKMGDYKNAILYRKEAITLGEKSMGANHPEQMRRKIDLADDLYHDGDLDQGIELTENLLKQCVANLHEYHPHTISCLRNLGIMYRNKSRWAESIQLLEDALKRGRKVYGIDHSLNIGTQYDLIKYYLDKGDNDKALALAEETAKLANDVLDEDNEQRLIVNMILADCYKIYDRAEIAIPILVDVVERLSRTLGPNHLNTLIASGTLGSCYMDTGLFDRAEDMLREVVDKHIKYLGPDQLSTLVNTAALGYCYIQTHKADLALPMLQESLAVAIKKHGEKHPKTLNLMNVFGWCYQADKQYEKAIEQLEKTWNLRKETLGADHPDTLSSQSNMIYCYLQINQYEQVIPQLEEMHKKTEVVFGKTDLSHLFVLNYLANCYFKTGKLEEALVFAEAVENGFKQWTKPRHGLSHLNLRLLLDCYYNTKRFDKAIPIGEAQIRESEMKFGRSSPNTMHALSYLGMIHRAARQYDQSINCLAESFQFFKETPSMGWIQDNLYDSYRRCRNKEKLHQHVGMLQAQYEHVKAEKGEEHPDTLIALSSLIKINWYSGLFERAIELQQLKVLTLEKIKGKEDSETIQANLDLGAIYRNTPEFAKGELVLESIIDQAPNDLVLKDKIFSELLLIYLKYDQNKTVEKYEALIPRLQKEMGPDHLITIIAENNLGFIWLQAGEFEKAEKQLNYVIDREIKILGEGHMVLMSSRNNLGQLYQLTSQTDKAVDYLRDCLSKMEKLQPYGYRIASVRSMLGNCLTHQGEYEEAEKLLLAGYEELLQNYEFDTPDWAKNFLPDTMDWLIELYQKWEKPDQVEKWEKIQGQWKEKNSSTESCSKTPRNRPNRELLSNVVFSGAELGGLLHDSVGEFDSLNEWDNLLVAA